MKRKVIQIADSTQLVSLPRKWALQHGVKKGDEIDVQEEGNKIIISTEGGIGDGNIEVDITGLDRDSLMFLIRCLYIRGYDEIRLKFDKPVTQHHKEGKEVTIISSIHEEVNRLNGVEVIEQKENLCLIKDIAKGSISEFDSVLRRIFLLLVGASNDLIDGGKKGNFVLLDTINEKHNTITKFIAYNLRLLNKFGYKDGRKTTSIYRIIASLDMIIDIIKYSSRYMINNKIKISKETSGILSIINNALNEYRDFFYNFDLKKVEKLSSGRSKTLKNTRTAIKKIPNNEIFILVNMEEIFEIIVHITVSRMAMEY